MRDYFAMASFGLCFVISSAAVAAPVNIPAVQSIVDAQSNVWTLASGVVYENGNAAGYTAHVVQVLYDEGVIYQQNSAGNWWSWNGGSWVAAGSSATRAVDVSSNVWTLVSGVVYLNDVPAGYSSDVTQIYYNNNVIYQQNTAGTWWSWNGSTWVASANPQTQSAAATSSAGVNGYPNYNGMFGVQVSGNKLVSTQSGAAQQIVGSNVSGLEEGESSMWPSFSSASSASWAIVKNWGYGLNTVRLPLNEATWLNYQCEDPGTGVGGRYTYIDQSASGHGLYQPDPSGTYQQTVINAVANATAAGLYVILDLHWGAPNGTDGVGLCPIGQPGFADADHSLAFWKSVADTFKNNPAVMFELFNEPYGDNNFGNFISSVNGGTNNQVAWEGTTMRDGGSIYPFVSQNNAAGNASVQFGLSYNVAGTQAMVDIIRGESAGNVILTAPVWWAGQIQLWTQTKPSDSHGQLAASWHDYGWTGPDSGHEGPASVLNAGFPIVMTEQWNVNGVGGGYSWLLSQGIGFLWWGMNVWNDQSIASEFSSVSPWFDTADQATPPNY